MFLCLSVLFEKRQNTIYINNTPVIPSSDKSKRKILCTGCNNQTALLNVKLFPILKIKVFIPVPKKIFSEIIFPETSASLILSMELDEKFKPKLTSLFEETRKIRPIKKEIKNTKLLSIKKFVFLFKRNNITKVNSIPINEDKEKVRINVIDISKSPKSLEYLLSFKLSK